jgi:hypothetical protein
VPSAPLTARIILFNLIHVARLSRDKFKYHAAAEYHAAALYIVLYHAQHIQLYTQTLHLHAQSHQHMIFFASFFPLFDLRIPPTT